MEERQANTLANGTRLRVALEADNFDLAFQPQFEVRGQRAGRRREPAALGGYRAGRGGAETASGLCRIRRAHPEVSGGCSTTRCAPAPASARTAWTSPVSVNLSPSNLLEPDLPELLERGLSAWRIPPRRLGH
jgi:hypothetical protein